MKPFYSDNHITIYNKSCRDMSELPDESVQCVVTSPPYFGLRKYSGAQDEIWGGNNQCEHQWQPNIKYWDNCAGSLMAEQGGTDFGGKKDARKTERMSDTCSLCGAWRGSLGLESTIELYLLHLLEIMREIRRVLKKDGTFFLNLGDSYASGKGTCFNPGGGKGSFSTHGDRKDAGVYPLDRGNVSMLRASGLKPLDMCLIPFRVALAAQSDGWWVRSIICWSKPNPMPESVNGWRWSRHRIRIDENGNKVTKGGQLVDCPGCPKCLPNDGYVLRKGSWRPTESHEYILMLTKTATYFSDADAVREPHETLGDKAAHAFGPKSGCDGRGGSATQGKEHSFHTAGRNLRSVWTFPTVPFPTFKIDGKEIDHFAVFPEKLPELCIKASTPEIGCCAKCGAPWVRITKPTAEYKELLGKDWNIQEKDKAEGKIAGHHRKHKAPSVTAQYETIGWRPTCKCNAPAVPSLVLDPFAGAGTTLWEAKILNRQAAGYEISEEYCQLIVERVRQQTLEL